MIGNALRIDIEKYAGEVEHNVLFTATRAGKITREMMARYVTGIHYLLTMTPIHLRRARARALAMGNTALAEHFQHKMGEEVGHDAWAENDLAALEAKASEREDVLEAAKAMMRNNERLIDEDPSLYLAYIAFVEYFTVIIGPKWLLLLEERCGIPRAKMTAVGNHVELDREHAEEGFAVIDDLVGDPKMLVPMREAMMSAMACYDAWGIEVVGMGAESGEIPAIQESTRHVSAA